MIAATSTLALPQMTLPFGVEIQPAALLVPQTLSDDQVIALGRSLRSIHTASAWWIADYILYVADMALKSKTRRAGKAIYEQVSKLWPTYSRGHLSNLASVARRVPPRLRSEALSFDHHVHIATLADEREAEQLQGHYIRVAVESEMTADELRMAIADTRRGHAHPMPKRQAIADVKQTEPAQPRGVMMLDAASDDHRIETESDGLPIVRPDEPEPLADSHAQLAAEAQRALAKLADWYKRQRKRARPEDWTTERKKALEHELRPLIDAMSHTADLFNELTNAEQSGDYA